MPEERHNLSILQPENLSPDPKGELRKIMSASRSSGSSANFPLSRSDSKASVTKASKTSLMKKGTNYKFKLGDLAKYSAKLRVKDIDWKFHKSSLGKDILPAEERAKRLKHESYLYKLAKKLK
jgi:hypothetical protein